MTSPLVLNLVPALSAALDKAARARGLSPQAWLIQHLSCALKVPTAPAQPVTCETDEMPPRRRAERIAAQVANLARIGHATLPETIPTRS